jgi:hypothetical protein
MGATAKIEWTAIEKILAEDTTIWTMLMKAGQKAEDHWKEIAEFGQAREHTLKSGYVVHIGDYKNSIRHTMRHTPKMVVRVQAHDFKAHWVEFGRKAPFPYDGLGLCAKVRAYMIEEGFIPL